ncbi:MAG: DsbA family oxidoreductase [Dehalococcoidia bacterium]|nr:DsbA family oxidoreductase [Dehalococcoidia bacterium]MDP6511288.1 DsbA family oxidoreductase [Dehalococcoidia bacterium]MDP6782250.1 DsbA family oxidoreductase [Dehalococcoidia bacterium]
MAPNITIYSDYICPFCLIGKERADRLEKNFGIEVEWKGLEIHPETPPEGSDLSSLGLDEDRVAALRSRVLEMAQESGLKLEFRSRISNSRLALQVAEFAKGKGRFKEYHDAVFRAYWQESHDIGDRNQLLSIAVRAGLDIQELKSYLESDLSAASLDQSLEEAMRYGISGVPTFIIGNKKVVGAQPYEVLEGILRQELSGDSGKKNA